jgi:hypothetical protein
MTRSNVRGGQCTFHVRRGSKYAGVINANNEGFVLINADDLWPPLLELKGIGYSPVTTISCKNILSVRLDVPLEGLEEMTAFLQRFVKRFGFDLEPIE